MTTATLMQNDAVPGVGSDSYPQCEQAFDTGKLAMFWDDAGLAPALYEKSLDPAQYQNTGIDELPCPKWNPSNCVLSAPWGTYINANASKPQQLAAYELLEYLTSPKVQIEGLDQSANPVVATRSSTVQDALQHGLPGVPKQYLQATQYAITHIEPNAIPVTPAFNIIQSKLFVILSELIAKEITPQQSLDQLQSQMTATLKTFHLPPS